MSLKRYNKKIILLIIVITLASGIIFYAERHKVISETVDFKDAWFNFNPNRTTGKWDVFEINLATTNAYLNPYLNPYVDIRLNATFTNPAGTRITVDGFWDGGNNWKIRIAPAEIGVWSYVTSSNDPQLNGKTGSFGVVESGKKGFVVRDSNYAFAFKRSNGEHIFLMGDTVWNMMSNRGGLDYLTYKKLIDKRSDQKFNFIRGYFIPFYTANWDAANYNEGGKAFEPWDPDHLNPYYFQQVDRRIAYANSKGIILHLLIGGRNTQLTDFFGWNNGKMERYNRYLAARYSAYDMAWEGRAEFDTQRSSPPGYINLANAIGNWIVKYDPYNHIQSMHPSFSNAETNNILAEQNWLDWIMHQSRDWDLIILDRQYNKPVMNEEFYYEDSGAGATLDHYVDADTVRKGAWMIMTHGASGFAYGNTGTINSRLNPFAGLQYAESAGANYMTYLYKFWITTKYWKLSPSNSIVKSGDAFVVEDPGNEYVLYLPAGGSITVDLSAATNNLSVEWYNPRTGTYKHKTTVEGGASRVFKAPDSKDWVLHIN